MDGDTTAVNLKAIAAKARDAAFTAAGDTKQAVTYLQAGTVGYNAGTGAVTANDTSTAVTAVVASYTANERSPAAFREGERRFIIKREDLPAVPSQSDRITEGGRTWQVLGFIEDPADAVWNIVCKRGQQ